jgi:hypothetical protein
MQNEKPPVANDPRAGEFKELIFRFYFWRTQLPCPWEAVEAMQLKKMLSENPNLDAATFKAWLLNYGRSGDCRALERPCKLLMKIHNYSAVPVNKAEKIERRERR